MKLGIVAIGRARQSPESALTEQFLGRLPQSAGLFETESKLPAGHKRTYDESHRLIQFLERQAPSGAALICLHPAAKDTSSEMLAQIIRQLRDEGRPACYFAIGGADGHHRDIIARADRSVAFGSATWPHMLCRAMLAEQLYRAEMILAGHPYHHG
jgi:23S rRNA (pseudouridine1915-N3)-methyltransferase